MAGFVRYGAKVAIARAGTYKEVVDIEGITLGPKTLQRFAALIPISEYSERYLYVVARAVSSHEKWGCNDNGDSFEWEELLHAYPTFIRGGVYKDHNNRDCKEAIGIIIDAWPSIAEQYIEVLMAINKKKAPNEVRMIQNGQLDSCSMGCLKPTITVANPFGPPKMIKDFGVFDKVLTHTGQVKRVQQTFKRSYIGDMYKVRVQGIPGCIELTPEHPIAAIRRENLKCIHRPRPVGVDQLCRPLAFENKKCKGVGCVYSRDRGYEVEFVRADELRKWDFVGIPFPTNVLTPAWVTGDFARLLGYYLAEGSLQWGGVRGAFEQVPKEVYFSFNMNETEFIKEVKNLCDKLTGKEARVKTYERLCNTQVIIWDKVLAEKLYKLGGQYSKEKRVAEEVLYWHPDLQLELLGSFINGDGFSSELHRGKGNYFIYLETASEVLANQLCMMLSRNGVIWNLEEKHYKPTSFVDRSGKVQNLKESITWRISISPRFSEKLAKVSSKVGVSPVKINGFEKFFYKNYLFSPITRIETYPYSGFVYNLEVEDDHSYVTNRVAVHNCVVDEAICSICGNVARDENQYCDHIKQGLKGREINGKKVFEFNKGVRFFEVSLISPWSEAADPEAKIRETLASRDRSNEVGFEGWIINHTELNKELPDREGCKVDFSFGQSVVTKDGARGVVTGMKGEEVSVILEGSDGIPRLFRSSYLTLEELGSKEVFTMAETTKGAAVGPRVAQGENSEDFGMEHPMRGNPTTGRHGGDYGSPAEKYQQDYNRTEVPSDETNLRGDPMSSMKERGDYPHKGYSGDKAEGKAPISASREVTAAELESEIASTLETVAGKSVTLEEVKEKEAKKTSVVSKIMGVLGISREADYTEFGRDNPDRGSQMSMKDPADTQYGTSGEYSEAQKAEADEKDKETRSDIGKQRPFNWSNTPENVYENLPKVATAEDVSKLADMLKKVFKEKEELTDFIETVRKLEEKDFDELTKMLKGVKEEEDKEVEKVKEKGPEPPKAVPKVAPKAPVGPAPGPKAPMPPIGPPGGSPPKLPGAPGPGAPIMGDVRVYARQSIAARELVRLAADLGQYGEENPVAHAKRLVLQQISRDPSTDPTSIFWLASDVQGLDEEQMSRLAGELHLSIPGIVPKTASLDYRKMSNAEILGAYKALTASSASPVVLNEVLTAMVQRGIKLREAAEKKDVLRYIYERMTRDRVPYSEAKREAETKFEVITTDKAGQPGERPLGFGYETEGPGSSSELGHQEPSDGRRLDPGTSLPAGVTSREYDERIPYRSSGKMKKKAADGKWLNDYEITFGTNTQWDESTKGLSEEENVTQKKDFAQELKEARKRELVARGVVIGGRSLSQWVADLKQKGAPAKDIRQFEHIWKSALDQGKDEEYAAKAAIDKLPKQYLEEPTKEHGPGKSGPKASLQASMKAYKSGEISDKDMLQALLDFDEDVLVEEGIARAAAGNIHTGPDMLGSNVKGAPSVDLAQEENKKQEKDFAQDLKKATGLKLGQKVKIVVGADAESHLAEIADINTENDIIHVDYEDGIRNRDAIDLKEGRSKVFGSVRVYTRPEILTIKKGNWVGYGDGSSWSVYNFHRESGKIAEVKLSEADPKQVVADFQLKGEDEVPEFFNSREYGKAVLDRMQELENQGDLGPEAGTGLSSAEAEPGEIAIGASVLIAEDWMPTGEETEELVNDIVQLRDEQVSGTVEAIDEQTDEVQVNFGSDRPLILSTAEIRVARDVNEIGTDVRWTEESRAQAEDENKKQKAEFAKEQVLSSFGPDTRRNTHLAQKTASKVGQFEEHVVFMSSLVRDAGLSAKEALPHVVEAFEMDEGETEAFVGSDEYTEAFEMPLSPAKVNREPEFGEGKEVTQMRIRLAGVKKHLCTRIATEMLEQGMIKGITADMGENEIQQTLDTQINKLMKMDEQGLYEFEEAVKSASDPDGIEALRKRSSRIGPKAGTLQQPLMMRGASTPAGVHGLDDPDFFM